MPDDLTVVNTALSERPESVEAWVAAKRNWIGASEVGSLFTEEKGDHLGFDSPLELLRKKAGMTVEKPRDELEIYSDIEPGLLKRWERKRPGVGHAWLNGTRDVYYQPDCPALRATPDAIVLEKRAVQLKVTVDSREKWSEHPPLGYLLQVQAEMYCTGLPEADLYALFRAERPYMVDEVWTVPADPELQREIAARATAFMSLVERWRAGDCSQTPELHAEDGAALSRLVANRASDEIVLQADARLEAMVAEWHGAKEYASAYSSAGDGAKKLEKMLRHRIVGAMGEASILMLPDGRRLRVKSVEREPYDVGESAWVDLSFVKPPKEKKK